MATKTYPLVSSAFTSCTYDDEDRTLTVVFTSGDSYDLQNVPPDEVDGFVNDPSPGRYWHTRLKGRY